MDTTILNQLSTIRETELRQANSIGHWGMAWAASARSIVLRNIDLAGERLEKRSFAE
jgi:hypothetical protein